MEQEPQDNNVFQMIETDVEVMGGMSTPEEASPLHKIEPELSVAIAGVRSRLRSPQELDDWLLRESGLIGR
jgi:hypothetical protein